MASATQTGPTDESMEETEAVDEEVLPQFYRKVSLSETSHEESNASNSKYYHGKDKEEGIKPLVFTEKSQEVEEKGDKNSANVIDNSGDKSLVQSRENVDFHSAYKCSCGENFEKSAELAAHKRWTCILVEKKLQCDICKSWFAHEKSLRRHMKHSHQGNFSCSHCDLKFHNRVKLTRHWMEYHFDDSVDKKLKCFLCGEDSFQSKFELESHLLIHKYNRRLAKQKCRHDESLPHGQPAAECIDLTKFTTEVPRSVSSSSQSPVLSTLCSMDSTPQMPCWISSHFNGLPNSTHSHPCTSCGYQQQGAQSSSTDTRPTTRPVTTTNVDVVDHSHNSPSLQPFINSSPPHSPPLPPPYSFPSHSRHHRHHLPPHYLHPRYHSRHHPPHHAPPHHPPLPHRPPTPHHPSPHHPSRHPPPPHTEPSSFPPAPFWQLFNPHQQQFPFFGKHHKRKHHHDRWKKYFKNIMCQQFPPPWAFGYYPQSSTSDLLQHSNADTLDNQAQSTSCTISDSNTTATKSTSFTPDPSELDSVQSSSSFKMICKFCDQIIDKGKATQHRLQDCPFIPAFKCNVCDKVFRKHHKLLHHMTEFNHYLHDRNLDSDHITADASETSSISNLYKRLDSALDFHNSKQHSKNEDKAHGYSSSLKPSHDSVSGFSHSKNINQSVCEPPTTTLDLEKKSCPKKAPFFPKIDEVSCEESEFIIDNRTADSHVMSSTVLQCSLCHTVFNSVSSLCDHLQSHITHVTSVQKVHEWKEKSSWYFTDSKKLKGESSVLSSPFSKISDASSISSSTTLFQGMGGHSIHSSKLNTTVESESVKTDTITDFEKWLKPHCKKRGKKRRIKEIFRCEFCDECFSFKKSLACHIKEKHADKKKKLECPVCQKKFSWKKRGQFYERHLSSHYGVTIFKHKCEICDKTFLEKGKLQAHMAVQHGKAEDLMHTCHICGKGYGTKSSLTRHLRHHTGDKPHQCGVCHAGFLEKRELTRHMASHTGVPAFVCSHCGQGFTLKTSLDTHIKRKHSHPVTLN